MTDQLSYLYGTDFDLSALAAMTQRWSTLQTFSMSRPRPMSALMLFLSGSAICEQNGTQLFITAGDLVYLPENAVYTWQFDKSMPTRDLLAEFHISFVKEPCELPKEVCILDHQCTDAFLPYFVRLSDAFSRPAPQPSSVKSAAYALLSAASGRSRLRANNRSEIASILPGIRYLEENPEQDKSVRELAELCHVSTSYFEKLFHQYAGVSPTEYRNERKLERAEMLIRSGTATLEQIAEEVGFYDSAYLIRLFRKKYGVTPGRYRRSL